MNFPYSYTPVVIAVDEAVDEYLKHPWPRFLVWCMQFFAKRICNGIAWNCGTPTGVYLDQYDDDLDERHP